MVVAIDLAGDAATGSFRSSMQTLAGKTDLEIAANGGIDEAWIGRLAALPYDVHFAPVIEAQAVIEGIGSVPVYGVDLLGAGGVVASRALAARIAGPRVTLNVAGRTDTYSIARTVDGQSAEFLLLDIAEAEKVLGRYGKLDRIDVTVGPDEDLARVERAIRGAAAGVVSDPQAGCAQRREPADGARVPLEPAGAELHFAGGGRVPDLQHHLGERGAAPRGDRDSARDRRGAGNDVRAVSG